MKKMGKFICLALMMFLLLPCAAFAQELSAEAAAVFQAALPGHTIALSDQCGFTAAAVLTDGQNQVLCVAEQQNGVWELAVCNPTALRKDSPVTSLLLDTDEILFWSYNTHSTLADTFHAVRNNGEWLVTGLTTIETSDDGSLFEYHLTYDERHLYYTTYFCDENENILSSNSYMPAPAAWLAEWAPLNAFADSRFPKPNNNYTHSWLSDEAAMLAAAELFPGDTFLGGCAKKEHLEFFLLKPNGEQVIAICRLDDVCEWVVTRSTPLPQGTTYGLENFSSSLVIGDLLVSVGPLDQDTCGVTFICNIADDCPGTPLFSLARNRITGESPNIYGHCYGDHPWSDITAMDWNSLPQSLEEALNVMNSSSWAVVNNPNPTDRLHLRAKPDRSAQSLGKYHNGTPMRILEKKGDWVRVDIYGITGWMMAKYLAFGDDGYSVEAAFPSRVPVNPTTHHYVYAGPAKDEPAFCSSCANISEDLLVLGVVGDEWYHVWFPDGDRTGYVRQSDWYEGNG